jgi:NAD(P)-dependent dehydrogenase (short-subunit alcohol dehydrogenase family)
MFLGHGLSSSSATVPVCLYSGLVLCAGIDGAPETRTPQGNELHMSVNHLGHMLLAAELMPLLRGANPAAARVVSITSSAALDTMVAWGYLNPKP